MSLHNTITALNAQGERLTSNVERLNKIGIALGGPAPERDKAPKGAYPAEYSIGSAESLESKFDRVVFHYANLIDEMIDHINRIETFVLDVGPGLTAQSTRNF